MKLAQSWPTSGPEPHVVPELKTKSGPSHLKIKRNTVKPSEPFQWVQNAVNLVNTQASHR